MSGTRQRSRGFCFTLNHPVENDITKLDSLDCQYLVYGHEVAPTTGTPHLQGYVYFTNARAFKAVLKLLPVRSHVEVARGTPTQNIEYCTKDSEFTERGERPLDPKERGEVNKERWNEARAAAKEGRYDDIPSDLYIRYQSSFKRIRREDQPPPADLEPKEKYGVWIWGPPRTGKSHKARTEYAPYYLKDMNKWWDGYEGEANALLDEFEPNHAQFMTSFLKRWADRWTFSAETKGAKLVIRPQQIVVTSNYSMEECFHGVDLIAMKSRFQEIHLTEVFNLD